MFFHAEKKNFAVDLFSYNSTLCAMSSLRDTCCP